jgi:hypothetical protein
VTVNKDTATAGAKKEPTFDPPLPAVGISALKFHRDRSRSARFNVAGARSPSDVYTWRPRAEKYSDAMDRERDRRIPAKQFVEPELVKWKVSMEKKSPAFYKPNRRNFRKRPVIINIHGGPEAQYRPGISGGTIITSTSWAARFCFPTSAARKATGKLSSTSTTVSSARIPTRTFRRCSTGFHHAPSWTRPK